MDDKSSPPQPPRLSALLWRAARASSRLYRARLAEMDLTARQGTALLALVETPGQSLGSLADALGADQATASALIDRLLAADLVRRETDPGDRRRARLFPTSRALDLAGRLDAARRANEALLEEALGPKDVEKLEKLLGRLADDLERQTLLHPVGGRPS